MAKLPAAQSFDADGMAAFLGGLDQIHLVAIHKSRADIQCGYFGTLVDSAVEWAQALNPHGFGIYWTVNRVRNGFSSKPAKSDITAARFVHVDIDPPRNFDEFSKAATLETLDGLRHPPSFVIDSGNGLQAFWRLDGDCANLPAIEGINQQVRTMFNADACFNIDRLMRVPGAVNWPSITKEAKGRKATIARMLSPDTGECYDPQTLAAFFPEAEHGSAVSVDRAHVDIGNVELITCDDLRLTPFHPVRLAVEKPKGSDRSANALHAACEMIRDGYDDERIAGILLNPANAVSGHILDQGNPLRAARRTIERARGEEPNALVVPDAVRDASIAVTKPSSIAPKDQGIVTQQPAREPAHEAAGLPDWYAGLTPGLRLMVDTIMHYAPSPRLELALGAAISCFATAAGRRYQSPTGIMTNVYCVALMASGAGKDFPLRAAAHVLTHAGAIDSVGGRIVSAMGVRSALEKQPVLFVPIDEMGKLLSAINNPRGVLKDAVSMLLELYSESQSFTKGGMYANTKERETTLIYNPCLSFFGVATPGTFWESLTSQSVADGFLPRMILLIDNEQEPEPRMDLARCIWPDALIEQVKRVIEGVPRDVHNAFPMGNGANAQPKPYAIPYVDEAAKLAWFDMKLRERDLRLASDAVKHPFYNRLAENATKLAIIRAVDRNPEAPVLTADDFAWGRLLSQRSIDAFEREIGENLADSDYHARLKRVQDAIRKAGAAGISANEIGRKCQSIPLKDRQAILEDLEDQGAVVSEKAPTAGRPKFIYRIAQNNA